MLRFLIWLLIIWLVFRVIRSLSLSYQRRTKRYPPQPQPKNSPLNSQTKIEDAEFEELPKENPQEKQSS